MTDDLNNSNLGMNFKTFNVINDFFPFFLISETFALVSLAVASIPISFCLILFNRKTVKRKNNQESERIPLQEVNSTTTTNVIEIFRSEDKTALKELISNENEGNTQINQVLRMVNIDGTGPQDVASRREINRSFMTCLIAKLGRPEALIWIKKHLDPEFCNSILSDMNYTGQHFKQLLSMLPRKLENVKSCTGSPLIVPFLGPRKNRTNGNPYY